MAFEAKVIQVMIASPSDVSTERELVREALYEWNAIHSESSRAVLLPVGWETHAAPELGDRAQSLINKQVLQKCDLLIGVFWTRLGTPTGESESGSVEEIKRHVEAGKPAMVYFSSVPAALGNVDLAQFQALSNFKKWCQDEGLTESYESTADFSSKIRRQIQLKIRDNEYISNELEVDFVKVFEDALGREIPTLLSDDSAELLVEATKDSSGRILKLSTLEGLHISVNGRNFVENGSARSEAKWEQALHALVERGLVNPQGHKGEIFKVSANGYEVADNLG